jgi:hypothetical protein
MVKRAPGISQPPGPFPAFPAFPSLRGELFWGRRLGRDGARFPAFPASVGNFSGDGGWDGGWGLGSPARASPLDRNAPETSKHSVLRLGSPRAKRGQAWSSQPRIPSSGFGKGESSQRRLGGWEGWEAPSPIVPARLPSPVNAGKAPARLSSQPRLGESSQRRLGRLGRLGSPPPIVPASASQPRLRESSQRRLGRLGRLGKPPS